MNPNRQSTALFFALILMLSSPSFSAASDHDASDSHGDQSTSGSGNSEAREDAEHDERIDTIDDVPVFKPPKSQHPEGGLVGGATRGVSPATSSGIQGLAPNQVGLTAQERPVFYWYTPKRVVGRADLVVVDESQSEPIARARIPGPFEPGIQRVRLADYGLALEPGVVYQWLVTVSSTAGDRGPDTIGGAIERIRPTEEFSSRIASSPKDRRIHLLAAEGIWYDALDELSIEIDRAPADLKLRRQRAALLNQVGLKDPAAADLAAAERRK